ncbi:substrate-binding domain-containing protein [Pantoea sp. NPDC088449]|uniref:substrate-binding domain-containing protein n=1 Tax=Pantoea sp. NPDC088449 TaxID=3364392 RepID=UPI00381D01F8
MKHMIALATLLLATQSGVQAATLKVFSSGGMYPVIESLKQDYQQKTGNSIQLEAAPSMGDTPQAIPNRLKRHDSADVLVMVDYAIKPLEQANWVDSHSHQVLAHSYIAMAVKQGSGQPDISSVAKFKQALTEASSIAVSDSASGKYIQTKMLGKLALGAETAKKIAVIPATPVGEAVAQGKAELGFQQNSELKAVQGITIVGLIPQAVQQDTLYGAVITRDTQQKRAAAQFVKYLQSDKARQMMQEKGLTPY